MSAQNRGISSKHGQNVCYTAAKMTIILFLLFLQMSCGQGSGTMSSAIAGNGTNLGVSLVNSSTELAPSDAVSVVFSTEIDSSTINATTFQLTGPEGPVSGTVKYDTSARIATFTPTVTLLPQTAYTAVVSTNVKGKDGQTLSEAHSWTIRTATDLLARSSTDAIPQTLFGQHMHRAATTTVWPTTPFGTWRLWDAYVAWPNLEPKKGEWHFETLDKYVALSREHNVELALPLALSPQWASARPTEKSSYGAGLAAEPANIEDWKNYVRTVVTRYKGQIHIYELWNEVNVPSFYSGSVDQMVSLSKEAYQIIKTIDPAATVVSPSCTGTSSVSWFQRYVRSGGLEFADVVGYHFYVGSNAPEEMPAFIASVRQILSDNNYISKPLWNTESGWVIENLNSAVTGSTPLTVNAASGYVARAYILNWASGVARFYWYAWDNYNMGFVETDGKTVKAPAVAYAQIYKWLTGSRMVSCGKNNVGTWIVRITSASGRLGWIVWNGEKTVNMTLPSEWNAEQMTDLSGNVSNLTKGQEVMIGPAPILIEK